MSDDVPTGWVKPQPRRTLAEVQQLIAVKREELEALELEAFNLIEGPRLEALVQIRNIMRAHQISLAEITDR
ncbi:MAG: hypothetical protein JF606_00545 [Burkholderiales bacterium]|nr:hypothetical protein [Burkholderiales bacterium]